MTDRDMIVRGIDEEQQNQIRRMVILDRDERFVEEAAFGDVAGSHPADRSGEILQSVSDPDGTH